VEHRGLDPAQTGSRVSNTARAAKAQSELNGILLGGIVSCLPETNQGWSAPLLVTTIDRVDVLTDEIAQVLRSWASRQ
jgi:hypothetical protein